MDDNFHSIIAAPFGELGIKLDLQREALCRIEFLLPGKDLSTNTSNLNLPLIKEITAQLQQYFINPAFTFHIPLHFEGTHLYQKIWNKMQEISMGTTVTYGNLAAQIDTSPRVIGNACRKNPIPLIVPCHRVVAANGIGGFAGEKKGTMLSIKEWLLNHERSKLLSSRS